MTDVNLDLLEESTTRSSCPYKGDARYWSALIDGRVERDIAWSYADAGSDTDSGPDLLLR